MIATQKQQIDLATIVQAAGVELKRSGTRHVGPCPFHAEKTPSFYVFQDNRFHCFGCGGHGDVIDFIQKMYGLSFPDALKQLGIKKGPITPKVRQNIERRKQRAELVRKFRDWEQHYCWDVSDLWHQTKRLMMFGIPPGDLELYAPLFHMLPVWEHHIEILIHGTDKEKFRLYQNEAQKCKKKIST